MDEETKAKLDRIESEGRKKIDEAVFGPPVPNEIQQQLKRLNIVAFALILGGNIIAIAALIPVFFGFISFGKITLGILVGMGMMYFGGCASIVYERKRRQAKRLKNLPPPPP